jgi:hypothetical protein
VLEGGTITRADGVVQRTIGQETFLVPIRGQLADLRQLFVLNEVGSWLWERLGAGANLADLVAGVVAEFEVGEEQARPDALAFAQQLLDAGLAKELVTPVA